MPFPQGSDLDSLLAHAGWVRALAKSLVTDPNAADDLVQETWVAALEHPPREGRPLKRWLAAILRNFAREERRSRAHRVQRERASARPEATPSAHDAVASALLQQTLIQAVLALDEPYRDAIIWRYFEALPPREIARRQGVSVNTVKTRLVRGLEKLRTELDRRHQGDRQAWLPALIPLAGWPALPASTLGTLLVNTKLKIAIVASLLLGSLAGVWTLTRTNDATVAPREAANVELSAPPVADKVIGTPDPSLREAAGELQSTIAGRDSATPAKAASPFRVRGRVIDVDSRSVAGVAIVSGTKTDREPFATSRGDGSFEGPASSIRGGLRAQSAQYTTVFGVDAWANYPQSGLVVVVAPRILLGGSVVDEDGKPVVGAEVQVRPDRAFLQDLGLITDQSFEMRFVTKADERGQFEFLDAPGMRNAKIVVEAAGFEPSSQAAAILSTHELRIVLSKNGHPVILGQVLDPRNEPVPGAWVAAGLKTTRTDALGRFVFEPGESVTVENGSAERVTLVVVKEGFLPARVPKPEDGWPKELTVRLEGSPLSIRGRVADLEDHPVAGAEVWTVDEHQFAQVPDDDSNVEMMKTLETMLRGTSKTTSRDDGSFELGGLLPGSYRIACSHKSTLRSASTDPVQAGSENVTIHVPLATRCVRVAGRVLSRSRKPVVGVYVFPCRVLIPGGRGKYPGPSAYGEGRITDEGGRFAYELLCPDELYFQVSGQNLAIEGRWDPPPGAPLDDLEIVVSLRCHVQVDLGDRANLADGFKVLDDAGKALDLVRWQGPVASVGGTGNIPAGRSDIVAVSEEGRTLVLTKAGAEVQRIAVRLVPGEVTVVRP